MRFLVRSGVCGVVMMAMTVSAWAQQPMEKISFGLAGLSMNATIPRFVDAMGLFKKHSLDINFVVLDSASGSVTALIAGSVQFALSGPGELIAAQGRGQKVVSVFNTYMGLGGSLVLSKAVAEKRGIKANSPLSDRLKALDGLTIASPSATSAYTISYKSAIESVGAKATFTYMAQPSMASALQTGAIQGFVASAPAWVPSVIDGAGMMWISGPRGDLPPELRPHSTAVILTMPDYAEANPATVKKVVAALSDFVDAVDKHPEEVKAAVAKVMPNLGAQTLDLVFPDEAVAWNAKPLTSDDLAHEIGYVKAYAQMTGTQLPQIDSVTPSTLVYP